MLERADADDRVEGLRIAEILPGSHRDLQPRLMARDPVGLRRAHGDADRLRHAGTVAQPREDGAPAAADIKHARRTLRLCGGEMPVELALLRGVEGIGPLVRKPAGGGVGHGGAEPGRIEIVA